LPRKAKGSVQELPKRETVAPAQASQSPVSKEDVMTTHVATKRNGPGGVTTNNQRPAIVRGPPNLDSSKIIAPAATKDTAKDALNGRNGSAARTADQFSPVLNQSKAGIMNLQSRPNRRNLVRLWPACYVWTLNRYSRLIPYQNMVVLTFRSTRSRALDLLNVFNPLSYARLEPSS
jgi:hypothetical protein